MEQLEQSLIVVAGVGVGEHERFEFRLPGGPIARPMSEDLFEVDEVVLAHGGTHLDGPSGVTGLAEQRSESIPEELIVDRTIADGQRTQDFGEVLDRG
jgi:hypothetical protein